MSFQFLKSLLLLGVLTILATSSAADSKSSILWRSFDERVFAEAKANRKLILLNLEAVWCHWCHVMERESYADSEVQRLISLSYIPVKVDQDSRPDLANRYRDYGWPATIVLNERGEELAKRAGFVDTKELKGLLERLALEPKPEREAVAPPALTVSRSSLPKELREQLLARHLATFDSKRGGLKTPHRYLEPDSIEYALSRIGSSEVDRAMVELTLRSNRKLFDPVWGGVYQYSTGHDWNTPHFEKLISVQARNLRIYSAAYLKTKSPQYLTDAREVWRYIERFLLDEKTGAFFVSQDADLKPGETGTKYYASDEQARLALGLPRVDKNIYARENGWVIEALAIYYAATLDPSLLKRAVSAAELIEANRSLAGGGFSHSARDEGGPFLGDTLAMGRAALALYGVTADSRWLKLAESSARFIMNTFTSKNEVGFYTSTVRPNGVIEPVRTIEENIQSVRFFNLLSHTTGDKTYRAEAERAFGYLASPQTAMTYVTEAGILLADEELAKPPLHIAIVGERTDVRSKKLLEGAIQFPTLYKHIEWIDHTVPPKTETEIEYPQLDRPAAYICTEKRCSLPIYEPQDIAPAVAAMGQR